MALSPQAQLNFLDNALNRLGSQNQGLPYQEDAKQTIRRHIADLINVSWGSPCVIPYSTNLL